MTGRERILAALNLRQPDRVPVWIHGINEKSIIAIASGIMPGVPPYKAVDEMNQQEMGQLLHILFQLHEILGIDGFTSLDGSQLTGITKIDAHRFRDAWGTTLERSPNGIAVVVDAPLKSEQDIQNYHCPALSAQEVFMLKLAKDHFGDRLAQFFLMRGTFVRSYRLRGMENLFIDMIADPESVHLLARKITDYNLGLCDLVAAAGADVLIIEDDIADKNGTLISPKHFREFIAPYNKEILDRAHRQGLKVIRHSDGNLWPILDMLIEMGYDGLNPLEPQAGMDLKKVKEYCGAKICLLGNIDCGELLCTGTQEAVEEAVRKAIAAAAAGGGYVLCSSNSIHPGVKPENFLAMVRAAHKFGVYPKS